MAAINNDYISSMQTASNPAASAPTQQLGQKEFLRLLTTQMQNQDPSKPQDPTSFITDLTQMNQLDATTKMNSSIQAMTQSFQSMQMMQSAALLGKSVQVDGEQMSHTEGQQPQFKLSSDQGLTDVKVVVANSTSGVVRTLDVGNMGIGEQVMSWDGMNESGVPNATGVYQLTAYGTDANGDIQPVKTIVPSTIRSLSVNPDGSVKLTLDTGEQLPMNAVREISA